MLEDLRALAPVEAVRGNMDDAELRAVLPERRLVEIDGVRIGMVHDPGPRVGREARLAQRFPGCAVVVYGHTHEPSLVEHDGVVLVNPGSPTERRRSATRGICVADVVRGRFEPRLEELP